MSNYAYTDSPEDVPQGNDAGSGSGSPRRSRAPLDPGIYRARALGGELGESKTGKEQVSVMFEMLDAGFEGRTITWYGYFTEGTAKRTLEALRYCGWEGDDLSDLIGLDKNIVELDVQTEVYNGKTQTKVKWVNKPGGVGVSAPLAPDKKAALAARMRGLAVQMKQAEAAKAQAAASKPHTPQPYQQPKQAIGGGGGLSIDPEDIPFAV